MKALWSLAVLGACVGLGLLARDTSRPTVEKAAAVTGEYVEARTCDVWTGPCYANAEMNTTGEFAVMGWKVGDGRFRGEDVSGLLVAAAIRADGTLATEAEGKVRSIVYVDERASAAQAEALVGLAKELGGKYVADVVDVRRAAIGYERKNLSASIRIADTLAVETTPLNPHCDRHCGNEEIAYPSLAHTDAFDCAKVVTHFFRGEGLSARWSDPYKRSAILGTFSL